MTRPSRAAPRPNPIERALALVSPAAALRRLQARTQFEALNSGYKGASRTRQALAGWQAPVQPPDEVTRRDLPTLHARTLDLLRDNPLAAGAHHTKAGGVVGTGLKLNACVDRDMLQLADDAADAWEDRAEHLFSTWAASKDCHVARKLSFYEQQDVAFRAVLTMDHFVQITQAQTSELPFRLALQHISGRRVCNADGQRDSAHLIAGIEHDAFGAPVRYHVLRGQPNSQLISKREWDRLDAFHSVTHRRQVLHLYRALDADQVRGIPDLAPVIEPLKQLDRYSDAELDAALKNALYAVIIQSDQGEAAFGQLGFDDWNTQRGDWYERPEAKITTDGSHYVRTFPGDTVQSFDPNRPNASFDPFVQAVISQIGVALELPKEVLTKAFNSSYSAARAALLQAQQFFTGRRVWLAANFCQPVYAAFIDEQVAAGRLSAPGYFADPLIRAAYLGSEWIGDAPGHIDETKAVDAAERRIAAGLSTRKRECAALTGEDWDKVRRELAKERRLLGDSPQAEGAATPAPSAEDLDQADRRGMVA